MPVAGFLRVQAEQRQDFYEQGDAWIEHSDGDLGSKFAVNKRRPFLTDAAAPLERLWDRKIPWVPCE